MCDAHRDEVRAVLKLDRLKGQAAASRKFSGAVAKRCGCKQRGRIVAVARRCVAGPGADPAHSIRSTQRRHFCGTNAAVNGSRCTIIAVIHAEWSNEEKREREQIIGTDDRDARRFQISRDRISKSARKEEEEKGQR